MARPENVASANITSEFIYQKYIIEKLTMEEIANIIGVSYTVVRRKIRTLKYDNKLIFEIKAEIKKERESKRPIVDGNFIYEHYVLKNKKIGEICNEFDLKEYMIKRAITIFTIEGKSIRELKKENWFKQKITKEFLIEEYEVKRKPTKQIIKELNCSYSTLYLAFDRFNIPYSKIRFSDYDNFDGDIDSRLWVSIKERARECNFEFNITLQYIWDLYLKQNKKCALSGLDITLFKGRVPGKTASLDRIDSSKGYIIGNVQWTHVKINRMKWNLKEDIFFDWIKKIYEFNFNYSPEKSNKINGIYKYYNPLWINMVCSARDRKIEFNLTPLEIEDIFNKQNGKCKYSNVTITTRPDNPKENKHNYSASLDRIDSSRGYIKDNIQWTHKTINLMKLDLKEDEFLFFIKNIYLFRNLGN